MTPPALEELDLTAGLAAFRDQSEKHGHTAERDAELPICHFADTARRLSAELADVLAPGDRQSLPVAYRRAARLLAFSLATMRRIRLEQGAACNTAEPPPCRHPREALHRDLASFRVMCGVCSAEVGDA